MLMSLHEQFIPGRWVDDIDVNDFVKLNKKPFLEKPVFLINSLIHSQPVQLTHFLAEEKKVDLRFSSLSYEQSLDMFIENESVSVMKRTIGYSEDATEIKKYYDVYDEHSHEHSRKTTHHLYDEIATSDLKKMFKLGLLQNHPYNYTPMFIFPDIRIIPLYGIKQIIKEKRYFLTKLEKYLQTTDWIQTRIKKHQEIKALKNFEKFAKSLGVNVSNPATSTKEVLDMLYVSLLAIVMENPSVDISLTDTISFIDIFAEKELQLELIQEKELQELLDTFITKIMQFRFTSSPRFSSYGPSAPFMLGETFEGVTKTSYRFLSAISTNYNTPFALRVIWNDTLPSYFKDALFALYEQGIPLTLISPRVLEETKNPVLLPFGMQSEIFDEIPFYGGGCDLEKCFYMAVNGGKEIHTNTNLSAITTPIREKELVYKDIMKKYQDFLTFMILSYVDSINALLYINDNHDNHAFRASLTSNQPFYSAYFGFFNLKPIVNRLAAIQNGDYTVTYKQKWIATVEANKPFYEEEEIVMTHLISYIKRELQRIPLYKEAKHMTRFYLNGLYDLSTPEQVDYTLTLPPEYMKGHFHTNIIGATLSNSFVKESFSKDLTELNLSKDPTFFVSNGVLFHADYNFKK